MPIYKTIECDVLVIGGGVGGLGAAIKAKDYTEKVVLVDKAIVGRGGSSPFVNYMWLTKFPEEDSEVYMREIIEKGEFLCDQEWVKIYLDMVHPLSMELEQWGRQYGEQVFEKDDKGNYLHRQLVGNINTWANVYNPIPALDTLKKEAKKRGVNFVERTIVTDLAICDDSVVGVIGFNYRTGDVYLFKAKAVVTAAGMHYFGKRGVSSSNNGELITAAYEAGAVLYKLEMTHSVPIPRDYASEELMHSVLSGGGRYVNAKGEEFIDEYLTEGVPARLQDLSIAFANEVKQSGGSIYADVSQASPEDRQFHKTILSSNDFVSAKVPWIPNLAGGGGVRINTSCESSLPGLYAVGDNSGRPPVGTYNVNGIMISYAYVSGCIAGENAARYANGIQTTIWDKVGLDRQVNRRIKELTARMDRSEGLRPHEIVYTIQKIISPWPVSLIRSEKRLLMALSEIQRVRQEKTSCVKAKDLHELVRAHEATSLVILAEITLRSALFRQESRGFHFREDYPYTDNHNWLKNVMVKLGNGSPRVWAEDVPTPYIQPDETVAVPPGVKKKDYLNDH